MVCPILISVSVTPGASAAPAGQSPEAKVVAAVAPNRRNERRVIITAPPIGVPRRNDHGAFGLCTNSRRCQRAADGSNDSSRTGAARQKEQRTWQEHRRNRRKHATRSSPSLA